MKNKPNNTHIPYVLWIAVALTLTLHMYLTLLFFLKKIVG